MLITGDNNLRTAGEEQGVEVHGTLWLLDQLHANGHLPDSAAHNALKRMVDEGSWLPKEEVQKRLTRWR